MTIEESIKNFNQKELYDASKDFFNTLGIPIDQISSTPIAVQDIFEIPHDSFRDVSKLYAMGMLNDIYFKENRSTLDVNIKKDYQGILLFSIELKTSNPTRKVLADISRAFNREYHYTPVVILFKYDNKISLSNTQRQAYKIDKEGEKTGKVIILRDVNIDNPHRGHIDILDEMKITTKIDSYESLYQHWQRVFDVSVLNKSFYKELSNWYFWTLKENNVNFPNAPTGLEKDANTLRREHNAKNVIRLLTRLLFVWFMKEKRLIPDELFSEEYIKNNLLKEFDPKKAKGLFANSDKDSKYYKAVLQNLFFATLNQEMGKRAFRLKNSYGQHQNITNLMRYENYFINSNKFVDLVEKIVPFMNGGLFECLDKPHPTLKGRQGGAKIIYEDGFSDRSDNTLVVPDYIFFIDEIEVDLSQEYDSKLKQYKNVKVRGLLKILESYKFTVAENTPIEEDVALDPELLGKVFENLLASYNPETKTTARKQTGSFYTPREIVSYMVDESLITYLKTKLKDLKDKKSLNKKLHQLIAYNNVQPFKDENEVLQIINAIGSVKILDPAVGSGAFPMGILQKMVHILHKLDPDNKHWLNIQLEKAHIQTDELFKTLDNKIQNEKLKEIYDSFNGTINHPDYARKLYLIENTIFGVDIQPIAIQISKLRFFISLIVEQNVLNDKANFGIRPLPNLESKFVTANTLVGIDKKVNNLFELDTEIKNLENKLKSVRHKIFNTKVPKRKRELIKEDKKLRDHIADELIKTGFETKTARMLSGWDPYDQNASSPFFDTEWMFGITNKFDIIIGNPPYANSKIIPKNDREYYKKTFSEIIYMDLDLYEIFMYKAFKYLLKENGCISFIVPNSYFTNTSFGKLRNYILEQMSILNIIDIPYRFFPFENVNTETSIFLFQNKKTKEHQVSVNTIEKDKFNILPINLHKPRVLTFPIMNNQNSFFINLTEIDQKILANINDINFNSYFKVSNPSSLDRKERYPMDYNKCVFYQKEIVANDALLRDCLPALEGNNILRYKIHGEKKYTNLTSKTGKKITEKTLQLMNQPKIVSQRITGQAKYRIVASLDLDKHITMPSINIINVTLNIDNKEKIKYLKTLLIVMNSSIYNYLYKQLFAETNTNITSDVFNTIPIPEETINIYADTLNILSSFLLYISDTNYFYTLDNIANAYILEIYLSQHMKEKQINIIEFVEKDIEEVMQGRDFDSLDDEQKNHIIQTLHDRWTHPDNKVRNRIKLFAVNSPDILRPILES